MYLLATAGQSAANGSEIEVTSVKKSKAKKKKGKKKKTADESVASLTGQKSEEVRIEESSTTTQLHDSLPSSAAATTSTSLATAPGNAGPPTIFKLLLSTMATREEETHNNTTHKSNSKNSPSPKTSSTNQNPFDDPPLASTNVHSKKSISDATTEKDLSSSSKHASASTKKSPRLRSKDRRGSGSSKRHQSSDVSSDQQRSMDQQKVGETDQQKVGEKSQRHHQRSKHESSDRHRQHVSPSKTHHHPGNETAVTIATSSQEGDDGTSWVKQMFADSKKVSSENAGQRKAEPSATRRLIADEDGDEDDVDKQFVSGAAKFTTVVEDRPSSGGSDHASGKQKPVLLPVDGPTISEVKELLKRREVSKAEVRAVNMNIDQNTRLIFSLEICFDSAEEVYKLIQVSSPDHRGSRQLSFLLVTNQALYLLRKDGADHEGLDYSREAGLALGEINYLVIGLNWQSIVIVYKQKQMIVVLSGNEAVTRAVVNAINAASTAFNGIIVPLNKGDDWRRQALLMEIDKQLKIQADCSILLYSLVNWEQLMGSLPPALLPQETVGKSGPLHYRAIMLGVPYWKQGYFVIRNGFLYQYNNEGDKTSKAQFSLQHKSCGGCKRVNSDRSHSFTVVFTEGSDLMLSAGTEEEMLEWTQALCEAVVGKMSSPKDKMSACVSCGALITNSKVCIMKEEWSVGEVTETLITSCSIDDIISVQVDPLLPLYCIILCDKSESTTTQSMSWLLCFESVHELSKFSIVLAEQWKKVFQIDLDFTEVSDEIYRQRAYKAVDLMQASRYRSDSITRGRGVPLMI